MKTLVLGAGPLGCLYTHRLVHKGNDVTLLARGQRNDWIQANGLVLVDEMTGARDTSRVQVVDALGPEDQYDLAYSLHARAAQDEMRELAEEFRSLIGRTSVETPNIDLLKDYVDEYEPS